MNYFLFIAFFWFGLISGQNSTLLPSENVRQAFEKQYPKKKPIWTIEYSSNKEVDITYIANFTLPEKNKALAVYDSKGNFKAYKVQITIKKTPLILQNYLTENCLDPIKDILDVIDDKNVSSYEVRAIKDTKLYYLFFDKEGQYIRKIQVEQGYF
jgi:hypothetical protein